MAANGASPSQVNHSDPELVRNLGNFAPSFWGDRFTSITIDKLAIEASDPEINILKEQVRQRLIDPASSASEKISLIDNVNRLGLSYHFYGEIHNQLELLFTNLNIEVINEYDLFMTSFQFRVFRQFGFKMSCDVFEKFMDKTGKFMETLGSDMRGMLSLYEASYLRIRGEDILDEALAFSTAHLRNSQVHSDLSPIMMKQVARALDQPLIKRPARMEAALYIPNYEQEATRIESLLKLAKLDFNKLQLLYLHELSILANWYEDMKFTTEVPHSRQRLVEGYYWVMLTQFEPQYSEGRIGNTKFLMLTVIVDDIFDAYGTVEELQLYTEATKRWDESAMDILPVDNAGRWRFTYKLMLNMIQEVDERMTGETRNIPAYSAKVAFQKLVEEYLQEQVWSASKAIPTFERYMKNSLLTAGTYWVTLICFKATGDITTKDAYDWLLSPSKLRYGSEAIVRLQDDIVTYEDEQKRGQLGSAVYYYMKNYNVSEAEAVGVIKEMIEDAWKDMNEGILTPINNVPIQILSFAANYARVVDLFYKDNDGYTHAEKVKEYIELSLLTPMVI